MPLDLHRIDLNLLLTFQALNETRQVTKAAKLLKVSQPALSHQLARLRELFSDELFVKSPQGMLPTPRCVDLVEPIQRIFDELEKNIFVTKEFDPKKIRRTFRIRTTDYLEHLLSGKICSHFEKEAPNARISFTALQFELPKHELERGDIDVAIAGFFGTIPNGFFQQGVFTDSMRCCVRKNHPRIKKNLTKDEFVSERHIMIAPGGDLTSTLDDVLKKEKKSRSVPIGVSSYMSSGWTVANTDCILTAPGRLIESFEKLFSVNSFDIPIPRPPIHIVQVWHERQNNDPEHKWFRKVIFDLLRV